MQRWSIEIINNTKYKYSLSEECSPNSVEHYQGGAVVASDATQCFVQTIQCYTHIPPVYIKEAIIHRCIKPAPCKCVPSRGAGSGSCLRKAIEGASCGEASRRHEAHRSSRTDDRIARSSPSSSMCSVLATHICVTIE